MKRRWIKWFLAISAGTILILLLGAGLLHTPTARHLILKKVRALLIEKSGMDLQAASLRYNLFKGEFTVEGLTVRSASVPGLSPLFQADRVYVKPDLRAILRGSWDFEELQITRPRIHYCVGEDGRNNLPRTEPSSGPAPSFFIANAAALEGSVRIEDRPKRLSASVPRWQFRMRGDRKTGNHAFDFSTLQPGSVRVRENAVPIDRLRVSGELLPAALRLERAYVESSGSRVSVSGSWNGFSRPRLDLRIEPDLDLGAIARTVSFFRGLDGRLSGNLRAHGAMQDLRLAARLRGERFSALSFRNTRFDFEGAGAWDGHRLELRDLQLRSPHGAVSGSAELSAGSGTGENRIRAELRGFDLAPVWKLLEPPFTLASRGTGRIALNWNGAFEPDGISGDAVLTLAASRPSPGPDILPVSGMLNARLSPGLTVVDLQPLSALGANLRGQFSLRSFRHIAGGIQGDAPDIGALIAELSRFLGGSDGPAGALGLQGPLRFDALAGGELARPEIAISAEIPALEAVGLRHLSAGTEARIDGPGIKFQNTLRLPEDSAVYAEGQLDLGSPGPALVLDVRGDNIPATAITKMLDANLPASGTLGLRLHVEGPLDGLAGDASVGGSDLRLDREPLGRLDVGLKLAGKEIRSTRLTLLKDPQATGSNRLDGIFVYALDSGRFRFEADGRGLRFDSLGLPNETPLRASWNLTASGTGTAEEPSIEARIETADLRIKQGSLGPIKLHASMQNRDVRLDASASGLQAGADARITAAAPYPFDAKLRIGNTDLEKLGFKTPNGRPLAGALDAEVTGSGNLSRIAQSRFDARIRDFRLRAGSLQLHAQGPVLAGYRNRSIEIAPATLVSGNSSLAVSGRAPLGKDAPPGSLNLELRLDLAQAAGFELLPEGYTAEGMAHLDLTLTGTPAKPGGAGTFSLDRGTFRIPGIPVPLTDISVRATVEEGAAVVRKGDASWGEGRIALTGEFPFGLLPENLPVQIPRKAGPAVFSLDVRGLRPEAAEKLPPGITGLISVRAEGSATATDLRALTARIEFPDLQFRMNEFSLGQTQPSRLSVRDGILSVERLTLSGTETNLDVRGSAGILPDGPLDVRVAGGLNAALLTFNNPDLRASGNLNIEAAAAGTPAAPLLSGSARMQGGRLSLRDPRVVADNLTVRLELDAGAIAVREFTGTLNGGPLNVTGKAALRDGTLRGLDLEADVQDFFLNFPEGLKSSSSGTLTLSSEQDDILIRGNIRVLESSYRDSFEVRSQLMNYLKDQRIVEPAGETDSLLDRIRFDVSVRTVSPLLVQNNVARVGGNANLRLLGPFQEPSVVGRITLTDGGEIVLNQRTYYINRGTVTLTNQTRIEPQLDIQAQTRAGSYDITMQLTGPADRLSTTLTSEPALSEMDILSVLLTGKTRSETRGQEMQVARTQALALVAGQAGGEITDEARRALGLSTFRIDPGMIASESDQGARLTIGEDVTRDLSLIYSMNLTNGGDQIWAAEYQMARRLTTRATKQQDNSYRFELNHSVLFGGSQAARSTRRTRTETQRFEIGEIRIEGGAPFADTTLLDSFKVRPGQKYDFANIQKGLDRVQDFYFRNDHLEATVRLQRETAGQTIGLNLDTDAGPVVDFSFEGMTATREIEEGVRDSWKNGVFDVERLEDAARSIRTPLFQAGFLQSKVDYKIETVDGRKTVRFLITPGPRYASVPVILDGAESIPGSELLELLDQANLRPDIYVDPQKVTDYLQRVYRDRGHLQAKVHLPELRLDPATATGTTIIRIEEGPRFTIGELEFSGHQAFTYDELWMVIPTSSGSHYDPDTLQDAVKELETLYRRNGYTEVSVRFRVVQDSAAAKADLTFYIAERRQSVIRNVAIEGTGNTDADFVRKQLDFQAGDALDPARIDESRRRLYSTGIYASVDFQTEEVPVAQRGRDPRIKDVRVTVRVREIRPYRVQYGLFLDTDRGPGGLVELENRNFLGRAVDVGLRLRYDSDLKEARLYFLQPFVTKIQIKSDASAFVQRETRPGFSANRIGFSLFQERNLPRKYRFDYGYRYDHVRWNGIPPDPTIFQASAPVARLIATLSRDTRDSVLDATRGEFSSHSLEFGPEFLGSEDGFARYYGQYFRYVALDKFLFRQPAEKPKKPVPSKLIYAGALRLGLTKAFGGGDIISPERFFAGGGTTMRGFEQDMLGPLETLEDGTQRPFGGEGLFLFNNEIRFPIFGMLHGVGFVDIGNVYPRIEDFDFTMRKTAGAGLRLKIKFIPLRFDYGFKLDRRPGEKRGAFFFSIGQAF